MLLPLVVTCHLVGRSRQVGEDHRRGGGADDAVVGFAPSVFGDQNTPVNSRDKAPIFVLLPCIVPRKGSQFAGKIEAQMAEIRIDAAKAERMIAQILRDEKGLLPADANAVAANICRRLSTAMPMPTNPPLQGYRIISSYPLDGGNEFIAALKEKIADVNYSVARELWKMVYDRGRDIPATVVDP